MHYGVDVLEVTVVQKPDAGGSLVYQKFEASLSSITEPKQGSVILGTETVTGLLCICFSCGCSLGILGTCS